jgi:3-oxoacyl-[acyl-carrier protein] reductase
MERAFREQQDRKTLLGLIGQPYEIAPAATFLASDDARWITGQAVIAAGGKRMYILRRGMFPLRFFG